MDDGYIKKMDMLQIEEVQRAKALRDSQKPVQPFYYENNAQRIERIKDWYPNAYRVLEEYYPLLIIWPENMPDCVLKSAFSFIEGMILPEDRNVLKLQ